MPLPTPSAGLSNDEIIKLFLDINVDAADKAVLRVDELGKSLDKTSNKMAGFGQSALQTGRVVQDFTQGGIGGILNNIEGLSQALGGGAGLAGVLTILGVAAFVAKPYLTELWHGITGAGSNEVPKATDAVKRLGDELKVNKDRLEELAKQHKLTNAELAEFNRLTATQKQLEEDLEFARERAKQKKDAREKLARSAGQVEAEAAKERAENLGITLGGSQRELEVELFRNLGAQGKAAEAQLMDEISRTPPGEERDNLLRQLVKIKRASAAGPNRLANMRDLEGGAIGQGNLNDIDALMRLLPKGSKFRGAFQGVQPDAMEAANAEEQAAIDWGERQHAGSAKFRRAFGKRLADDKRSEQLTEQGRDAERRTNEERDRDRDHDEKKREHDAKQADREHDPTNRLSARIKAREDAATVEAERQNAMRQQAGAAPFSDAQLRSIASEAASFPGDLSRNIDAAMGQAMQKIMEMRMHARQANARLQQWGQQFQALPQMGESRLP